MKIVLDPAGAGPAFPRIHEGRYEADPENNGLSVPLPGGLVAAAKAAGLRLLRVGVGIWLPTQDPDPSVLHERDWFTGTTLEDTADPSKYVWTHLDRNLDICKALDVDLLLSVDAMPPSLARPGPAAEIPDYMKPFAPADYGFNDGVRNAPPSDPEVFAAAAVKLLEHVNDYGARVRYVELWNEPDLPFFYAGTYDEWFAMYRAFARAVHAAGYKVGGPSWAGALNAEDWLTGFLRDCTSQDVPIDFYSFHRYNTEVDAVIERCREVRAVLRELDMDHLEVLLDEWGYDLRRAEFFGTVANAAFIASCLMQLPDAGVDAQTHILLVDPGPPEVGRFHGLTRRDGDPNPIFFCFEAFERFQSTPRRIATPCDDKVLAGVDDAGTRLMLIAANPDDAPLTLSIEAAAEGTVRHLTPDTFAAGGWGPGTQTRLPADLVVEPGTMAVLEARL